MNKTQESIVTAQCFAKQLANAYYKDVCATYRLRTSKVASKRAKAKLAGMKHTLAVWCEEELRGAHSKRTDDTLNDLAIYITESLAKGGDVELLRLQCNLAQDAEHAKWMSKNS